MAPRPWRTAAGITLTVLWFAGPSYAAFRVHSAIMESSWAAAFLAPAATALATSFLAGAVLITQALPAPTQTHTTARAAGRSLLAVTATASTLLVSLTLLDFFRLLRIC